jgi:hypothetical protein
MYFSHTGSKKLYTDFSIDLIGKVWLVEFSFPCWKCTALQSVYCCTGRL